MIIESINYINKTPNNESWRIIEIKWKIEGPSVYRLQKLWLDSIKIRLPFTMKRVKIFNSIWRWPFCYFIQEEFEEEHTSLKDAVKHLKKILDYQNRKGPSVHLIKFD